MLDGKPAFSKRLIPYVEEPQSNSFIVSKYENVYSIVLGGTTLDQLIMGEND
ncbi:hypothetical protein SAMN04488688_11837 [Paenibacillus sp. cl141a]|nr:hypothetical protein SAMN04488688_11837 [Paenibacillus sp. cl141a]